MTPSQQFVQRLKILSDGKFISERKVCRRAGIKSTSQIAAARKRGSAMNWDQVFALTGVLEEMGYRREWLLFGEEPRIAGDSKLGDMIRLGPGARGVPVGSSTVSPVVEASSLKKRRHQGDGAVANKTPAPRQNPRRPKRVGSSNVDNR